MTFEEKLANWKKDVVSVDDDDIELARKTGHLNGTPVMENIEPTHYRKGEIDLFESWYLTRPFNEFRAIMESIAERYLKRDKENRIEDLDKAIYTLDRLKGYEKKQIELEKQEE